jgi:hypothetical protein
VNGSARVVGFGVTQEFVVSIVTWDKSMVCLTGSLVDVAGTGNIITEKTASMIVGLAFLLPDHTGKRFVGTTSGTPDAMDWYYPVEIIGMICRRTDGIMVIRRIGGITRT